MVPNDHYETSMIKIIINTHDNDYSWMFHLTIENKL